MTNRWRQHLSDEDQQGLDRWWHEVAAEVPPTPLEIEEAQRRNELDARRAYDPSATVEEELLVRLRGSLAEGTLPLDIGRELFKPLSEGVNAATQAHVELALAGVLPGSTVLRIRATSRLPEGTQPSMLAEDELSAPDHAVRIFLDTIRGAEDESDARFWPAAVRKHLLELANVLYDHQLSADFTWLAGSGAVRRSTLTNRGQMFARRLRDYVERTRTLTVEGTITELRQAGWVKVKPDTGGAALDINVDQKTLRTLHLTLFQEVAFEVRETTGENMAGQEQEARYQFVRAINPSS